MLSENKTPGQVAYEAWIALPATTEAAKILGRGSKPFCDLSSYERNEWEAIGGAVKSVFAPQNITDTTKPTKPAVAEEGHVHELGSYTHCDTAPVKPFPMPGQVWEFDGTDSGPFTVMELRWFNGNAEAVFESGVAGIKHMMELDAWKCVKAIP